MGLYTNNSERIKEEIGCGMFSFKTKFSYIYFKNVFSLAIEFVYNF